MLVGDGFKSFLELAQGKFCHVLFIRLASLLVLAIIFKYGDQLVSPDPTGRGERKLFYFKWHLH